MSVLKVETPPLHSLQKLKSSCIHIVQWISAGQEVEVPCVFDKLICNGLARELASLAAAQSLD